MAASVLTNKMVQRPDRREWPMRRCRMRRRLLLPCRQGRAVDHPHQALDRHGAARGLGRRFRRRASRPGRAARRCSSRTMRPPSRCGSGRRRRVASPSRLRMLSEPTRALRMGYDFARGAVNVEEPVLLAVCPTRGRSGPGAAGQAHHQDDRHCSPTISRRGRSTGTRSSSRWRRPI